MARRQRPHERDRPEPEHHDERRGASHAEDRWLELIADIILRDLLDQQAR